MNDDIFHAAVAQVIIDTVPVELPVPDMEFGQDTIISKQQLIYLGWSGAKYYVRIAFDIELDPCYLIMMCSKWLSINKEDDRETTFLGRVDHYAPEFQIKVWDIILTDFRRNYNGSNTI